MTRARNLLAPYKHIHDRDKGNLCKWIEALESGRYTQVYKVYVSEDLDSCRCALGVLEAAIKVPVSQHVVGAVLKLRGWQPMGKTFGSRIVEINDDLRLPFPEIAQLLRETFNIPKEAK